MTQMDSDWVSEFFASTSCDWALAARRDTAFVLYLPFSPDPDVSRRCASVLSDRELERVERLITVDGKANFIQRRAFRRYCGARALKSPRSLSQIVFEETDNGRPYLPELPNFWFSFSTCRSGFLGAWSSTHSIGVDLEDRIEGSEALKLAQQYFSAAEQKVVEGASGGTRVQTFLQFWCLKEAALKSIGEGLPFGLGAFEFKLDPSPRVVLAPRDHGGPERFHAYVIEEADCCAALVICEGGARSRKQSGLGNVMEVIRGEDAL